LEKPLKLDSAEKSSGKLLVKYQIVKNKTESIVDPIDPVVIKSSF
jgi:hypothetical protein